MKDKWIYIGALLLLIFFAVLAYSLFAPYQPYKLHAYKVVPDQVCMGDIVEIHVDRTLDEGSYNVFVDSHWENVDSGYRIYNPTADYILHGTGEKQVDAVIPALQHAPQSAGEWSFEGKVMIKGRKGILPRVQRLEEGGMGSTEVLPNSNKKCK